MASSIAKECGVCTYELNEEQRCPRLLPCFHSLCSSCIGDIIRTNDKKCPFCRQGFQQQRITDFRINNNALDLIKYVKDLESKVTQPRQGIEDLKRQMAELNSDSISSCILARSKIEATLKKNDELKSYLILSSTMIQEEVVLKSLEIMEGNKRHVQRLQLVDDALESQLSALTRNQQKLVAVQKKMDAAKMFSEAGVLMDNANQINSHLKLGLDSLKNITGDNENLFQGIDKIGEAIEEKLSIVNVVLSSFEERQKRRVVDYLDRIALTGTGEGQEEINVHSLIGMTGKTRALVQRNVIYAAKLSQGTQRYAKISIIQNKYLCVHRLNNDHVAPNVHVIKFEEVMGLVGTASNLCFIELKHKPSQCILGKLIIRLTHGTKKAKNFQVLCSAEKGPSFANTKILGVGDEGSINERVLLGDYEYGDGRGGKAMVPGAGSEEGAVLHQSWKAGAMTAPHKVDEKASQVMIYTRERAERKLVNVFGFVEEGLEVLTNAISSQVMKNDVIISDCGVILMTL